MKHESLLSSRNFFNKRNVQGNKFGDNLTEKNRRLFGTKIVDYIIRTISLKMKLHSFIDHKYKYLQDALQYIKKTSKDSI